MSSCGCREAFPQSELRRVLFTDLLEKFERQLGKASIEAAALGGALTRLERCPFCDFAMEMEMCPNENKIFVCQSDDCGKESCRLCKKENHIPLKCDEVETRQKHRLTVEERMSEALIRECAACKAKSVVSRFVKSDGCNKMTCPKCKGWVCYQCSQVIDRKVGYGHFCQHTRDPGRKCSQCNKCDLWTGTDKQLERAESKRVVEAGLQADREYRAERSETRMEDGPVVLQEAVRERERVGSKKGKKRPAPQEEQLPP